MRGFRRHKFPKPFRQPGVLRAWTDAADPNWFERLPLGIRQNLERSGDVAGPFEPRASGLGWTEVIYTPNADGTANTTGAEAIAVPDFSIPASYMTVGKLLRYTIMGRNSTAITTPGVITHRLRWGGVAGVAVVTSAGFIPDVTAVATNLTYMAEFWVQCRSVGASGTFMGWGRIEQPDANDIDITNFVIEYNKRLAPAATPAVATVDTTIDKLLSYTFANSVATGSNQTHVAILEALN